ncbi:MAG: TIGR04283 family arsenosugar biosynthesis glycosyltransferase [Phycisphaerae bacterium]|nr:TIGR04283 family arsenosugar biosynthesis glycosyltransferase [Phycisphaerae bacterium]
MAAPRPRLIVFTRFPDAGRTKTRLIPALGTEGAARLHEQMVRRTLTLARDLQGRGVCDLEVCYDGASAEAMQRRFGPGRYRPQCSGDLGQRLAEAFVRASAEGCPAALAIGTDCPLLEGPLVQEAIDRLRRADVVVGPADDGGYYLLALRRPQPQLFQDVEWGSEKVLAQTRERAAEAGLKLASLRNLPDVDRPEDLPVWEAALASDTAPPLSVIVPTLNEAAHLAATLAHARCGEDVELIVVDAGSDDRTVEIARQAGAEVVVSGGGRSGQLNAGAAVARGRHLLFCHADTRLPAGYAQQVRATLSNPQVAVGAFTFRLDDPSPRLRRVERVVRWRCRILRRPYGDQALFMRRDWYDRLGGFPAIPVMEDYALVTRAARLGAVAIRREPALTSARFWSRCGLVRTTVINQVVIAGYHLGVDLLRLRDWRGKWMGGSAEAKGR